MDPIFKPTTDCLPDELDLSSQPTLLQVENAVLIPGLWRLRNVLADLFIQSFDQPSLCLTLDINALDDPEHGQ